MMMDGPFLAVTFVDASIDAVEAAIVKQLSSYGDRVLTRKVVRIGPATLLPQQISPAEDVATLWAPAARATATVFYPNLRDGWHTMVHCLGTDAGLSCSSVRASSDGEEWPIRELIQYADGDECRFVRVMKDSPRWTFFEQGEPFDFEYREAYSARLIKKRLPLSALADYCEFLGWPVRDEGMWQSDDPGRVLTWAPRGSRLSDLDDD